MILHTRDRSRSDSDAFAAPLRSATGVFLGPGNAGRLAAAYLGTSVQRELEALLAGGGVVFGRNVAINPHLTSAKRDAELVNAVDAHLICGRGAGSIVEKRFPRVRD